MGRSRARCVVQALPIGQVGPIFCKESCLFSVFYANKQKDLEYSMRVMLFGGHITVRLCRFVGTYHAFSAK